MQIHAHTSTRRPRRALATLALLVALLLPAALAAAAPARSGRGHRAGCSTARHGRRAARHCAKRHSHKPHGGAHKAKKPAANPAPAPKLTPAVCEDDSTPARSADGSYSCEDSSEPVCVNGSEPVRPASGGAPVCHVAREEGKGECGLEAAGECGVELACEDAEEGFAGPQGCEHGSAFEEEVPETDA
jgi:hypothetical protein